MVMLTRGVCRAIPGFLAIALADFTTPLAMRPGPPSFSLAKMKIGSPLAMCLPPYIVFCALNVNVSARGSLTSALITNIIFPWQALASREGCSSRTVVALPRSSWLCLEIPRRDNVLRAFCFLYEVEPDVCVMLLGEPGFANQLGMNS